MTAWSLEKYLDSLRFKKKALGGVDEEEVLLRIKEVTEEYKKIAYELEEARAIIKLTERELLEERGVRMRMTEDIERLKSQTSAVAAYQTDYSSQSQHLRELIRSIEASKQDIIERAKVEARQEVDRIQQESEELRYQREQAEVAFAQRKREIASTLENAIKAAAEFRDRLMPDG